MKWRSSEWDQARHWFQHSSATRQQPYPSHLSQLPKFPLSQWLDKTIHDAKLRGEQISDEEEELATGCDF